jgi:hypothetical protein
MRIVCYDDYSGCVYLAAERLVRRSRDDDRDVQQNCIAVSVSAQARWGSTPYGPNVQFTCDETYRAEARQANHIFVIKLPNVYELRKEVSRQAGAHNWSAFPQATESPSLVPGSPFGTPINPNVTTHCSWAVKEALKAGGLPLATNTMLGQSTMYLPGFLADALLKQRDRQAFGQSWSVNIRTTPWCSVKFL